MKKIAMLLLVLSSIAWGADKQSVTVPFKFNGSLLLVDVRIDGTLKQMIFDTGAERTVVLDSRNVEHTADVSIGDMTVGRLRIFMVDMSRFPNVVQAVHTAGKDCAGLLGEDVLRQFKSVSVDYSAHTITLEK